MILAGLIMLWCILRGVVEGVTMIRFSDPMYGGDPDKNEEGTRCHKWFPTYHWLCIARDGALVAIVLTAYRFGDLFTLSTAGALILGWELFEAAYNYTRYRRFIVEHENLLGVYQVKDGADVWLLHSLRILCGCGLIVWGLQ